MRRIEGIIMSEQFLQQMRLAYALTSPHLYLGCGMYDDKVLPACPIRIAMKTLNLHGLIAGATGTGKTKTIQVLAEQLSDNGVASLVMDIKGDLSGLAMSGKSDEKLLTRTQNLGIEFNPQSYPVEFLSLSDEKGVKLRTTVTELGPLLLSKILGLNDTQSSVLTILLKYAKDNQLPVVDLIDLKELIGFAGNKGRDEFESRYGGVAASTLNALLRKVVTLESQVVDGFFSEPSFDVNDLVLKREQKGVISILRLASLQAKPKVFSTFMLGLLDEVYQTFPELGDVDKPKLVLFIDEAHLLFKNASKVLIDKLETTVKLIRSKGVGLVFCTQTPNDVPEEILSQLGFKIQHALRAFTAKDRKSIKLIAQNFPISQFYDTQQLLTSLGIGQALVTTLDLNGQPTPLVQRMMAPPRSRMGTITGVELQQVINQSQLVSKYIEKQDKQSAKEILSEKIIQQPEKFEEKIPSQSIIEQLSKNTLFRQVIRTIFREITRAIMTALGIKKSRSRKR